MAASYVRKLSNQVNFRKGFPETNLKSQEGLLLSSDFFKCLHS